MDISASQTDKKEIYLIRHGETDYNQKGIVQGRGVDSSLNDKGRHQAEVFYQAYKDEGFEKIYVSLLKRTYETVSLFHQIPFEKNEALDEISWGIHEGQTNGDTYRQFYEMLHFWKSGYTDISIEGGESPLAVQQRQLAFIETLKLSPEKKILLCSHGRAMRILLCTLLQKPLSMMDTFPHQNLCLYKLNLSQGVFTIDKFNDIAHFAK